MVHLPREKTISEYLETNQKQKIRLQTAHKPVFNTNCTEFMNTRVRSQSDLSHVDIDQTSLDFQESIVVEKLANQRGPVIYEPLCRSRAGLVDTPKLSNWPK
jgi:hypothetical protein